MIILLILYFAVVIWGIKFNVKDKSDYLSIDNTQAIKGIFILMVFFSHFNSYVMLSGAYDGIYRKFFFFIGQAMVALFLFYSGYGVMESIKRKGEGYIDKFSKSRILSTLFNFDCAVILYLILALILGNEITIKQVLLSLIGWDSLGNSNWYIFVILLLYLLTYIIFKIFRKKSHHLSVLILGIIACIIIYLTYCFKIKDSYWYDTILCYVFGMSYSLEKERIERIINKNIVTWLFSFAILAGGYFVFRGHSVKYDIIANLFFTAAVIVFTMHITLKNKILVWCGKNLFEIYILQRIPMIIFREIGLSECNVLMYFGVCLLVTILLSIIFNFTVNRISKKLNKQ